MERSAEGVLALGHVLNHCCENGSKLKIYFVRKGLYYA